MFLGFLELKAVRENRERRRPVKEEYGLIFDGSPTHMHKHETLAVLEALMKWEDKLLGRKFMIVTDHKGLEYFKTQLNLLPRQTRWWEYLSHLNYNTIHVDGT